jgi:glycyl-tRNA synthetase
MATASSDNNSILTPLRLAVQEQGNIVRKMKENKLPELEIQGALQELKKRKKLLEIKEKELEPPEEKFDRGALEDLIKRRFFYRPSFLIYGGIAGLYDFGPLGCAMKTNFLSAWRKHFVLEEGMFEVDTSILTPEPVLRASGHVERFADYMVKDVKTGDCYRADHLLIQHMKKLANDNPHNQDEYESVIRQADNYSQADLGDLFVHYQIKAPATGNDLSAPVEFNLMFSTSIGPGNAIPGFLRPETAQGIFVNFKHLLEFNEGRLPFAGAQIGKAFRNEISPRSGLLRVREFEMAEIEHFVDPDKKNDISKFDRVADHKILFYSACNQMEGKPAAEITVGEAVASGMVANKTLGYFIARIHMFLLKLGVAEDRVRFRQHMSNEMAHYACDCWDAECKTSYGWVECVGCADRSCYDLTRHAEATNVDMTAKVPVPEPFNVECVDVLPNKVTIGKQFRGDSKAIMDALSSLSPSQVTSLEAEIASNNAYELTIGDKKFTLSPSMISINKYVKTVHVVDVVPSVIEPSFGIGRILYTVLEHNFSKREGDQQRNWLCLPPSIAPISCTVLPLSKKTEFDEAVRIIVDGLKLHGISCKVEDSGASIGRRYARTDEIGIPYGITIDFDTLKTNTATLRERNTMQQIRAEVSLHKL